MYDVDAIEAINFEQLATVTDRLLLRGGRLPRHRPSTSRIGPPIDERTVLVRGAHSAIDPTVVLSSAIITTLLFIVALV